MSTPIRTHRHDRSTSTNMSFAGRRYEEEDETYYQQRKNFADDLKTKGCSHNQAWFKAFQAYPRIYIDPEPTLDSSTSDSQPCPFVFP
jgi:hypothetical protein